MSDSLEYAKMTEIPVSSCEITVQPEGKSGVKKKVINKVNTKLSSKSKKQKKGWLFKKKDKEVKTEN